MEFKFSETKSKNMKRRFKTQVCIPVKDEREVLFEEGEGYLIWYVVLSNGCCALSFHGMR